MKNGIDIGETVRENEAMIACNRSLGRKIVSVGLSLALLIPIACEDLEVDGPQTTSTQVTGAGGGTTSASTMTAMGGAMNGGGGTTSSGMGGTTTSSGMGGTAGGGTTSSGMGGTTSSGGMGGGTGGGMMATIVPDFSLVDENVNSTTSKQQVSPRDYLGGISAYYFAHST